jgi:hypothetical protein
MTFSTLFTTARPSGAILLALAGAAIGTLLRFALVEPEAMGAACETAGPWWCDVRLDLILASDGGLFGWIALALTIAASLLPERRHAVPGHVGLLFAGFGAALYDGTPSVCALVLGTVTLAARREPVAKAGELAPDRRKPGGGEEDADRGPAERLDVAERIHAERSGDEQPEARPGLLRPAFRIVAVPGRERERR